MEGRRHYLVRSSRSIDWDHSVVGVGWGPFRFCDYQDVEELIHDIDNDYGIGRRANQVRQFKSISKGDVILVPTWGAVAIGIATDDERYDPDSEPDGCNQRSVRWFRNDTSKVCLVPRSSLSHAMQSRCKIRQAIADMGSFSEELDAIVEQLEDGNQYSWTDTLVAQQEELAQSAKQQLLENIRNGNTYLQGGGVGLEKLVKELLEADGFTAGILSKRAFAGIADADVHAEKSTVFGGSESFLVQVKHHDGNSSEHGVKQLVEIQKNPPQEYADYGLAFVTSGDVDREVHTYAENNQVKVIDGSQLVDWIFENVQVLHSDTRQSLGILETPSIIR